MTDNLTTCAQVWITESGLNALVDSDFKRNVGGCHRTRPPTLKTDRSTDSFDWDRSQDPHIPPNSISSQLRLWHGLWLCILLTASRVVSPHAAHGRSLGCRKYTENTLLPFRHLAKPVSADDRTGTGSNSKL